MSIRRRIRDISSMLMPTRRTKVVGAFILVGMITFFIGGAIEEVRHFIGSAIAQAPNIFLTVMTGFIISTIYLIYKVLELQNFGYVASAHARARNSREEKFSRFESINEIRVGCVDFFPTCNIDATGSRSGFGPELIKKVFHKTEIRFPNRTDNWDEALTALRQGRYDILATPLYDTPDRRFQILFSSPLYYTDIGLFIKFDGKLARQLASTRKGDFSSVVARVAECASEFGGLRCSGLPGEIQERMTSKYFPDAKFRIDERPMTKFNIANMMSVLFENVESDYYSDIFWAERFQVECSEFIANEDDWIKGSPTRNKVINLLNPCELLFPTCFAIRAGEDTLRKYVNLRLMELEGHKHSGIDEALHGSIKGIRADADEFLIRQCYRRGEFTLDVKPIEEERRSNVASLFPRT